MCFFFSLPRKVWKKRFVFNSRPLHLALFDRTDPHKLQKHMTITLPAGHSMGCDLQWAYAKTLTVIGSQSQPSNQTDMQLQTASVTKFQDPI